MYEVEFSRQAGKDIGKVYRSDRKLYQRFLNAFESISKDPAQGKPLPEDLRGPWSYRMGIFRIVYETIHRQLLVVTIDLGHRREIYE